jgi:hypothetical protein
VGDVAEGQEGIDANHTQMCKFRARDDPGYKKVQRVVRNFVTDASPASQCMNEEAALEQGGHRTAFPPSQ